MSIPLSAALFLGLLIGCIAYLIGFKQGDEAGWRKRSEVHDERNKFLRMVGGPTPQVRNKTENQKTASN